MRIRPRACCSKPAQPAAYVVGGGTGTKIIAEERPVSTSGPVGQSGVGGLNNDKGGSGDSVNPVSLGGVSIGVLAGVGVAGVVVGVALMAIVFYARRRSGATPPVRSPLGGAVEMGLQNNPMTSKVWHSPSA